MSKYIPPPPKRPPTVQRTKNISNGVSGNDVMLGFCCLLVGIIFGLLIGRFV